MSRRRDARRFPGPGREAVLERQLARLDVRYASLPALECRGLCAESCQTHVEASDAERARLLSQHGLDLDTPTAGGACPALSQSFGPGRCTVHVDAHS